MDGLQYKVTEEASVIYMTKSTVFKSYAPKKTVVWRLENEIATIYIFYGTILFWFD